MSHKLKQVLLFIVMFAIGIMGMGGSQRGYTAERVIVDRDGMQNMVIGACTQVVERSIAQNDIPDTEANRLAIFNGCADRALEILNPMPVQ